MKLSRLTFPISTLFATLAVTASAHTGHTGETFSSGLAHPVTGWDHLLGMIAVGLWASRMECRPRLLVLFGFLGVFAASACSAHLLGWNPPLDVGIAATVLVLGALIARTQRLPEKSSLILAGIFAIFHGVAHGAEIPAATSAVAYGTGFLVATAAILGTGLALGLSLGRQAPQSPKYVGWGIAAAGALLFVV